MQATNRVTPISQISIVSFFFVFVYLFSAKELQKSLPYISSQQSWVSGGRNCCVLHYRIGNQTLERLSGCSLLIVLMAPILLPSLIHFLCHFTMSALPLGLWSRAGDLLWSLECQQTWCQNSLRKVLVPFCLCYNSLLSPREGHAWFTCWMMRHVEQSQVTPANIKATPDQSTATCPQIHK